MPDLKALAKEAVPYLVATRRDIHQHPELGYKEERTAKLAEDALREMGADNVHRVTGTGVVATIEGSGPGDCLLLRADLDALPIEEDTGLPYASINPGVMHACGHDGHVAILLAAAKILIGLKSSFPGTIKLVFQPNEEEVGALAMIEEGVLDNPKVSAAAALHLWAQLPLGKISCEDGATWAGMDHFTIKVKGVGGHTATPQASVDPILVASHIVIGLQALQSRELDPFLSSSLVFGRVCGGKAANIIPGEVELEGTVRYLFDGSDSGPHQPKERIRRIAKSVAAAYRAEAEVDFYCSQPPMDNHPLMASLGRAAAAQTVGEGNLTRFLNLGGEDFSEFSARVPSVLAMIGAGSDIAFHPHHHPKFDIDERALPIALEWLLRASLSYLCREA